jgi:hypothetical protein
MSTNYEVPHCVIIVTGSKYNSVHGPMTDVSHSGDRSYASVISMQIGNLISQSARQLVTESVRSTKGSR